MENGGDITFPISFNELFSFFSNISVKNPSAPLVVSGTYYENTVKGKLWIRGYPSSDEATVKNIFWIAIGQ